MQNGRAINRASIDARTKALESYSMTEQEQADRRVIDEEKRRVQRFAMATGTQIEVVTFDDAFAKSHPFSESMPFDADAYGVAIGDSIYLNEAKIDPHEPNALRITMAHELTHHLERDAATYEQLCEFARSSIGNGFGSLVSEIKNYYASRGITLDRAHAEREIIANFASETLLQSPSAIASLVETSRPVANRFMEWLNGVLEKVGRYNADKMITRGVALYKNALNAANQLERERVEAEAAKAVEAAVPVQHALNDLVRDVSKELGIRFVGDISPKSAKSLTDKIIRKRASGKHSYSVTDAKDHARSVFLLDDFAQIPQLFESLASRGIKYHAEAITNNDGYRGLHLTWTDETGVNIEVQVSTPSAWEVKLKSDLIYEKWRNVLLWRMAAEQAREWAVDKATSRKMWGDLGLPYFGNFLISSSELMTDERSKSPAVIPSNLSSGTQRPLANLRTESVLESLSSRSMTPSSVLEYEYDIAEPPSVDIERVTQKDENVNSENAQVDGTATDVNEQEQQKASSVQEQSDVAQQSEQTDGEYYVQTRTGAKPVTGTMRDGFGFRTADGQIEVTLLDTGAAVHHAATVEEAIAYVDEHKAELIASQQTEEAQRKAANFRELRDASLQYRGQAAPATERRQRNTSLRDAIDTPIDAETADIQYSFGTDAGYIRNSLKEMDSDYNELAKKYDPNSSTNDSALVREELNGMVNAAANANGFEYRRCSKKNLNASNDVPLMMFSEQNDFEGLHIFGDHRYVATGKGALEIADVYDEISNLYEQYFGTDAREDDINPKDIVDSAGIWDNAGFVQFVWDNYFEQVYEKTGAVPAVALSDGLVVLGEDNSRIKSADPVVYDDAGNIIPLSERFNSSDPDIRWYNGFDYNGMLEKYGVIENFSRRPVPKKTSETKTTSKSAQKVAGSYVLSDKQHEEVFKPLVASEAMSYVPVANNKTLAAATTRANANTLAENIVLLRDMAESGRTNAEDGAFAQLMIQRAAQSGTQEELEAALAYSSIISVEAGRSLQIQSLLKRMSPNGKLRYMESIIGKINAKYATKLKQPYELTTAERNALLNSNSQEESDTIIEQISKRIGETLPLTFGDRIKAWRYFSMLSSAKTHLRNIMGNITMWSMYNVSDALGSVAENAAVSAGAMTQDERTRAVFSRALHKDVVDYSKAAFDERQGSLAQGSKFVDKGFGVEKYKRMFDWKPLDKAAKGVFNLLEKEDQFFMKKRFVSVMSQMIVARGYDVNNITDEQRTTLVQQASEEALKATFRDASKVADVLTETSKIKGVGLLVEGIIPFKKTPINVLKRGVDFSALGLLRGIYDVSIGVKSGKITTAEAISHLTDGLTGTAVMALGWLLSRLGVLSIVGGDGDDEDYDKYRRNLGDYQYMMSIGDVNLDLSGISPIVFPLFMGAAIDEVSENGLPQFESADDLFAVLAQVADPLTEMSMLSGVNTVLEDIAYAGDDGAISTVVRSALSSVAQQFIPTPIGQLERTFDQYSRSYNVSGKGWLGKSASYTAKAIQNKTPFAALSEPSIDLHGEEVKNFSGFGSFLLNLYNQNIAPVTVRVDRKDETDEEIMRVYEATLDTGVVPQKPNRSLGYVTDAYGETVTFTLTDSEYTEYQKELGQAIYAQLRLVMANESYATLDDDKKAQVLSNVISTVTSETKKQWKQMKIEQAAADGTLRTKKTP